MRIVEAARSYVCDIMPTRNIALVERAVEANPFVCLSYLIASPSLSTDDRRRCFLWTGFLFSHFITCIVPLFLVSSSFTIGLCYCVSRCSELLRNGPQTSIIVVLDASGLQICRQPLRRPRLGASFPFARSSWLVLLRRRRSSNLLSPRHRDSSRKLR